MAAGESAEESVAKTLELAGHEEAKASNFATAATLFERSAQLTPVGGPTARRLVQAADSTRTAGDIEQAYAPLGRALPLAETRVWP